MAVGARGAPPTARQYETPNFARLGLRDGAAGGYAQVLSFKVAVQGELSLPMQVSEQGSFNYGKLKLKDLNKDTYTLLPVLERELRISCEARTRWR